ncbi:MAG: hypothetical protein DRP08_03930 [Candidatus Aenigmatarchaeota archaeon]|nr:MAG: hypothetical protein DRP08_03930 [Candidatus Aenigmarchaeota archaeon]
MKILVITFFLLLPIIVFIGGLLYAVADGKIIGLEQFLKDLKKREEELELEEQEIDRHIKRIQNGEGNYV